MQLSKLEIKGFKSFGDKIVINFDEGITGIVGPNGCGKSNVVDAIRWVLGEQKTSALRSEKMENIIFNGTKNRKPTNMAEVSLTFNNTKNLLPIEYNQVTITRRYYRSGDSEYLLNGVTCRLKDITNLFLDTGIASNSYAIIELKMVDDILNDKDNSRRHLFEEAAGISKFRIRKKETMKRLSDTDADLERVEDLLYEIEKNMRSLERQAKQAERYYKLKEEYKTVSIELAKKSIASFKASFEELKKQVETESDSRISLNKQITEREAELEKIKKELLEKEKLLASRQKTLNQHVGKIRHYESEKKIKNERLKFLTNKTDSLREQLDQDKQSNQRATFSLNSLRQEKESSDKILLEIETQVRQLEQEKEEQKFKTRTLEEDVQAMEQVFKNHQSETYQLEKDIEIREIQLSSMRQELEKTHTDSSEQSASLVEFESKIKLINEELDDKKTKLAKLEASQENLGLQIANTEKTLEVIKEEKGSLGRKLDSKRNEFNLTKSLVENLEGFPEAIKFLKKKANWKKEAPLLSDIIACDEKYRVAIENFLENYMNYYVVDDLESAYQAINILNDAAQGKANFFVINKFEKFHPGEPHIFDNATPASELVEFDSKFKKLVSYLLDNVYIVDGDEKVIPEHEDCIFITLNGKVIKKRFSVSGGSIGLFEGKKIGRAKNLEKLEKEIKSLDKKLNEVDANLETNALLIEELKEKSQQVRIEELKEEIIILERDLVSLKTKEEQFAKLLNSYSTKREDIVENIAQLQTELEELRPKLEMVSGNVSEKQEKLDQLKDELTGYKELLEGKTAVFNEENLRYHQNLNKQQSLENEISYKEQSVSSSNERIAKNQEEMITTDQEIKKLLDSNEIEEDELVGMYDEKENIESGVNEAEKAYYAHRSNIDEVENDIRAIHRKKENVDELLMEMQGRLNEVKLEMTSVKDRLSVEFEVDAEKIVNEEPQTEETQEELKEKSSDIKQKLDRIGPINPMAMEAYNEIQERHTFITTQREDLFKAKESLLETIGEIDTVAKETFMEAYDKIKENFIKVFRSLFTEEDDCDLKLSDPENPLDSSIEIMAKPKGKRPLTINQLSGGEKTLTATSLLFSIYLLKPAPFCIFDEVDAPLDDANIDKFNNIIRKFSEGSQFIIVTHNKRTMAATDIIYGITMVEQGVSRVVPADLRELA